MTIRQVLKPLFVLVLLLPLAFFAFFLFRAFGARSMPPLQPWHMPSAWPDNLTEQEFPDFEAYLAAEAQLLDTIYQAHISQEPTQLNRYTIDTIYSPYVAGENLNASFHFFPSGEIKGGVLLLHGFTTSPYSLRALAEVLAQEGYYVLALRLPGHGTTPGALSQIDWQAWQEATRFGVEMVQQEMAKHQRSDFIIGGVSMGGTLALNYTLEALATEKQPLPDKVLLFAPSIEINPNAALARYTRLLNWMPYFAQFRWNSIAIEYDPFRYYSFPMHSIDQAYRLVQSHNKLAAQIANQPERMARMPPLFVFQSIVDASVSTDAVLDWFARYATPTSELVLFDINRSLAPFFLPDVVDRHPTDVLNRPDFRSRLVVMTNQPSPAGEIDSELVKATLYLPDPTASTGSFTSQDLVMPPELRWATGVTALSHLAILTPPEDPYYGTEPQLPVLHLRGENGVSALYEFNALRLRYNPFFVWLAERVVVVLDE